MSEYSKTKIFLRFSNVEREILETGIIDVIQIINDGLSQIKDYKPFSNDNGNENSGKYIEGIEFLELIQQLIEHYQLFVIMFIYL